MLGLADVVTFVTRMAAAQFRSSRAGAAGLQRLAAKRYDLVPCDMTMPSVSGADLYRALLAR